MAGQQQAAVVFVAGRAMVGWGDFLAGFGGLGDERLANTQNGWLPFGACG
jgi:hypothetical protein